MMKSDKIQTADKLTQVKTYYFASKLKEIAALNASGQDIINLGIGSPDMAPPEKVIQMLTQSLSLPKAHQYQSYYGLSELRAAFADFYSQHFKVNLDFRDEVLPLIGSKEGVMHIAMSFLNAGDEVLVPNPGYPAYKMTTLLAGGVPLYYDLKASTDWKPDFEALNKLDLSKVKLMWVNYPNMPTGQRGNKVLFEQLVAFGKKHQILICHDNPYAFILNDQPLSILSVPGAMDTCLELTSLSKSFNMAGWRVGAVLGAARYLKSIIKFKSNMDSGMFLPIQYAAAEALRSEVSWFNGLNKRYEKRRVLAWKIYDVLSVSYNKDSAGLFVWGKVSNKSGEAWSEALLNQARVFVTPGFIFGDNGADYLRISLCTPLERMEKALERIVSAKMILS